MEIETENKMKINWNIVVISLAFVIVTVSLSYIAFTFSERLDAESKKKVEYKNALDSARADVATLSTYRTLTESMSTRDAALKTLLKVGDIAYMKNDSSRVVIVDRTIGGGNFNYYIKYKILYKDGRTDEVTPELIFKK